MDASVIAGSDAVIEFECQPCGDDGDLREADGYCQECLEYLCDTCINYHRKVSQTKLHKILDRSTMPKTKVADKATDVLNVVCDKHSPEVIKYFCNTDKTLGCSICVSINHRDCKGVSYIPEVAPNVKGSAELRTVRDGLLGKQMNLTMKCHQARSMSGKAKTIEEKAIKEMELIRKELDAYLDETQATLRDQIKKISEKDQGALELVETKCKAELTRVDDLLAGLDDKEKQNKLNGLFITMKIASETSIPTYMEADQECPTDFTFSKDTILQTLKNNIQKAWSIDMQKQLTPQKPAVPSREKEIDVRSNFDSGKCYISGIVIFPDDRLVIVDLNNISVKLIDQHQGKVTSRVDVSSKPYDVAVVKGESVAVTLGTEQSVQMIGVSHRLTINDQNRFSVPGVCKGISYYDEKLYIVCCDMNMILICSMTGEIIKQITGDWNMPSRIALNSQGEMFVTDHAKRAVFHLAQDGSPLNSYRHSDLNGALGITYDQERNNVFALGWRYHTMVQLRSSGEMEGTLLTSRHGLQHPVAIASKDGRVYISMDSRTTLSNSLQVFQV